jgi:hypothetical protein
VAAMSEVRVKVVPELDPEFQALLGTATADTLAKLDAGAALAYAIYHCPKDQVKAFFDAMPQGVMKAYARACDAWRLNTDPKRFDADADPS